MNLFITSSKWTLVPLQSLIIMGLGILVTSSCLSQKAKVVGENFHPPDLRFQGHL